MYCINCGVKLADTEKVCPLCATEVFHPELVRGEAEPLYPHNRYPVPYASSKVLQIVVTTLAMLGVMITLLVDIQINKAVTWSGAVIGGVLVCYVMMVFPFWFSRPNPVIFVPCTFGVIILYLLYLNRMAGGHWFLSFAFPVAGGIGLILTVVVALMRYVRRGYLYIFGGTGIALGLYTLLVELLIHITFGVRLLGWSLYPMIALVLLGGMLIVLAISRPARETMERKFFI